MLSEVIFIVGPGVNAQPTREMIWWTPVESDCLINSYFQDAVRLGAPL